ncbi:MAG: hypothetical protein ACYCVD_15700 [Desulfitobacteriaceae bacterium]
MVRRVVKGRDRYYAQLVLEGKPFQELEYSLGTEEVGIDIGPSTIAIVGETDASLQMFCQEVVRDHKVIRRLQRHIDRERRVNNPDSYDKKGRIIKGKSPVQKSQADAQITSHLS